MASSFEIPLNPFPETFTVTINAVIYSGETRWNNWMECWVLSLKDANDVPLLMNVR